MATTAVLHLLRRVGIALCLVNGDVSTPAPVSLAVPGGQIADPALHGTAQIAKPKPETPDAVMHNSYLRRHYVHREHVANDLAPFSNLPSARVASVGWRRLLSPEGRPYFWHEELNLFTNRYIFRDDIFPEDDEGKKPESSKDISELEMFARELRSRYPDQEQTKSENSDLVLEYMEKDYWGYYFADKKNRTVFWVDNIPIIQLVKGTYSPVQSGEHLDLIREAYFWTHLGLFPQRHHLSEAMIEDLRRTLRFMYTDTKTSSASTAPYGAECFKALLEITQDIKSGHDNAEDVWTVARFMYTLSRERFLHLFGQRGARLDRAESIFAKNKPQKSTYLFLLLSPILFYMPDVYIKKLNEMFVDGIINEGPWNKFWNEMRSDWERSFTPVTVLLSTNVGFLAIQSVDQSAGGTQRSVAQIASYVSTILSLGSYLVWWILSRQHPPGSQSTATDAIQYLSNRSTKLLLGVEADAVVYSLPTALFTWSMLAFLVAMSFITLAKSDAATEAVISIVLVIMAITVAVVLHMDWGAIAPSPDSLLKRTKRGIIVAQTWIGRRVLDLLSTSNRTSPATILPSAN